MNSKKKSSAAMASQLWYKIEPSHETCQEGGA
jgi:hypothetical protein